MGRAGGGSHGGGHSAGGGHHVSHSGGGHRVGGSPGGSSRAGSGSGGFRPSGSSGGGGFFGGRGPGAPVPPRRGSMGGPGMPPPPPVHGRGPRHYGRPGGGCGSGCLSAVIILILVIACLGMFRCQSAERVSDGSDTKSTIVREKVDSGNAYINECIIDELGWFDNVSATETKLKSFWEKTGIQPYIILRDYDPELTTDAQKEAWAISYYDENFDTENIFLYVYFAEKDTDNDVGYMCYANGYETSSVMDSEAIEIFWNNVDKYWYTDMSTDDMFVTIFSKTGDTIMHAASAKYEAVKWVIIALVVVVAGGVVITVISKRNKRKKEEAAERQRILETPLDDLVKEKEKEMKE